MTRSAYLKVGALAALYLLWLAIWFVVGNEPYGPGRYYWGQASAPAATGIIALYASRRRPRPYPGFLVMQGLAFLLLAGSWVTYQVSNGSSAVVDSSPQGASGELFELISNSLYASCVFVLMCAWGYLALERWDARPLSLLTTLRICGIDGRPRADLRELLLPHVQSSPEHRARAARRRNGRARIRGSREWAALHAAQGAAGCGLDAHRNGHPDGGRHGI